MRTHRALVHALFVAALATAPASRAEPEPEVVYEKVTPRAPLAPPAPTRSRSSRPPRAEAPARPPAPAPTSWLVRYEPILGATSSPPTPAPMQESAPTPAIVPEPLAPPAPAPEVSAPPAPAPEVSAPPAPAPEVSAPPAPAPEASTAPRSPPPPTSEPSPEPTPGPSTEPAPPAPPETPPAPVEPSDPPDAPTPIDPVPDLPPADVGPIVTLRRPTDCRPHRSKLPLRAVVECSGEERADVDLGRETPALVARAPASQAAASASTQGRLVLPIELQSVYRVCPFAADPILDARPDLFVPYEDRDVGRCYLWAPLDRAGLAAVPKYDRAKYLATIHPYMAAVVLRAIAESGAAGWKFHVISGTRPGGKPSWHTFGLAVDVNVAGRKGLKEATRAFLEGGAEHDAWMSFAATAERLGLYWLGRADPDEIFHFEWRPGWSGLPHGEVAAELAAELARGGLPAVWERLRYDPSRPSAQAFLRDAPPPR